MENHFSKPGPENFNHFRGALETNGDKLREQAMSFQHHYEQGHPAEAAVAVGRFAREIKNGPGRALSGIEDDAVDASARAIDKHLGKLTIVGDHKQH